jgi:hypothetical protein
LLVQPTPRPESRTWSDYETTGECMEGICKVCSFSIYVE